MDQRENGMTRMRRVSGVVFVMMTAMTGCATSPEDVTREGSRFEFSSVHRPYAAAICIARNARAMGGGIVGEERLIGESSTEVYVRPSSGSRDALATAQIHGDGLVSKVSVQIGPSVRSDKQGFAKRLMAGC
jgi:starvation-inducible outer membrane lipoprotein